MRQSMTVLFCLCSMNASWAVTANSIVQIDVSPLLNSDVIVNHAEGSFDTSQEPIDSPAFAQTNYSFATRAAAIAGLGSSGNGLPDNAFFSASRIRPEVQLSWSNDDDGMNARRMSQPGQFLVNVPNLHYQELHFFAASGQGSSDFQVRLVYADGLSTPISRQVPDWFDDPAPTLDRYFLANGLDRVKADASSFQNVNDPALFGFHFSLEPARVLESVLVEVTHVPSGEIAGIAFEGAFSFFGATGVAVPEPSTLLMLSSLGIFLANLSRLPSTHC